MLAAILTRLAQARISAREGQRSDPIRVSSRDFR